MINRFMGVTLLTAGLVIPGAFLLRAQDDNTANRMKNGSMNNGADSHWIMKACQGGMAEVQLGNLAKDHAQSAAVKKFAERMVDDHSKWNDELKGLAAKENVTLPTSLDAKDQATMDRLSKLNGAAFDKAYMRDMVADHKKDISEFQKEANNGNDPDTKAWAAKVLPGLQTHLSLAQETEHDVMGKS